MNRGLKIGLAVISVVGIGVLAYFLFVKKDSPIYLLKQKKKEDENLFTPANTDTGSTETPTQPSAPKECPYASTGFKNKTEGDKFRDWVNDKYPATARQIDLDRSGEYDNCYIREAFYTKADGGRTLGSIYKSQDAQSAVDQQTQQATIFAKLKQLVADKLRIYTGSSGAMLLKVKPMQSTNLYRNKFQMALDQNGKWALNHVVSDSDYPSNYSRNVAKGWYTILSDGKTIYLKVDSGQGYHGKDLKGRSYADDRMTAVYHNLVQAFFESDKGIDLHFY